MTSKIGGGEEGTVETSEEDWAGVRGREEEETFDGTDGCICEKQLMETLETGNGTTHKDSDERRGFEKSSRELLVAKR